MLVPAQFLRSRTSVVRCFHTLLLFAAAAPMCAAATYYVSPSGSDSNPGTQSAPVLTIQTGINLTADGDTVIVEDGTYTGPNNVDLYFNGYNIAVQSANGPATTIINCAGTSAGNHGGFLFNEGETSETVSGFTIENAYEHDPTGNGNGNGGGIEAVDTSLALTVQNCILENDVADNGGGIDDEDQGSGSLTLTGCTVSGDTGSGIFAESVNATLTADLTDCTIAGNSGDGGGGLAAGYSGITLTNCAFTGNSGQGSQGGAIYALQSTLSAINCTFTGNSAQAAGGIETDTGSTTLTNDILYGDTGGENQTEDGGTATVNYCDVQGGASGTGDINANPAFVSATDLHLQPGSPCLGAGTPSGAPTTTLDGRTRPTPPSIGAYEMEASSTAQTGMTHILWNNTNGAASIWNYNPANGTFAQNTYGPYTGWTAKTVADGGTDGQTRVLWDNTNGTASIWSLNNSTGQFTDYNFGPYPGWTAKALSVGTNNTTHVLWDNTNGTVSVWNYNTSTGTFTQNQYGPYSGWTATAIADGPDGQTQLLWDNTNGMASIWSLNNQTGQFTDYNFGPYPNWTAITLSVGTNNTTHVLWDKTDGHASVWNYSTANGSFTQNTYGPYAGWTALSVADGADGQTRLLWDNTNGTMSLWDLNNVSGVFSQFSFGPYPGWTAGSVSAN